MVLENYCNLSFEYNDTTWKIGVHVVIGFSEKIVFQQFYFFIVDN